jgi:hypothetical protein
MLITVHLLTCVAAQWHKKRNVDNSIVEGYKRVDDYKTK